MGLADKFIRQAKKVVADYFNEHVDATDNAQISEEDDVFVVWFCKTLQNWKVLVSTTVPDGKYYEVTHDGDNNRTYLDVYVKIQNCTIEDVK